MKDYFLGGDIVKFQTNIIGQRLCLSFLRCSLMQTEIKENLWATNGHLAPEDIAHLPIPIPHSPNNKKYDHITSIRQQAQQLKDKTSEL